MSKRKDKDGGKKKGGNKNGGKKNGKADKEDDDGGREANWKKFEQQCAGLGLRLRRIKPDGNCLFRSVADQLEGKQERHAEYREEIVNFMREGRFHCLCC